MSHETKIDNRTHLRPAFLIALSFFDLTPQVLVCSWLRRAGRGGRRRRDGAEGRARGGNLIRRDLGIIIRVVLRERRQRFPLRPSVLPRRRTHAISMCQCRPRPRQRARVRAAIRRQIMRGSDHSLALRRHASRSRWFTFPRRQTTCRSRTRPFHSGVPKSGLG